MQKTAKISLEIAGILGCIAFYYLLVEDMRMMAFFAVPAFIFLGISKRKSAKK